MNEQHFWGAARARPRVCTLEAQSRQWSLLQKGTMRDEEKRGP